MRAWMGGRGAGWPGRRAGVRGGVRAGGRGGVRAGAVEKPVVGPRRLVALLLALVCAVIGLAGLATADDGIARRSAVVSGVPVEVVWPASARTRLPGVVVAHGLGASRQLMRGFADTLARHGYAVELVDLAGHGASTERLPSAGDGPAAAARLDRDLDVAVRRLRAMPQVNAGWIGLVGHSMGAAAVVRYASAHPDIRATVAISQGPMAWTGSASRPRDLLLLAGGLEFAGYRDGALSALRSAYPEGRAGVTYGDARAGTARRTVIVGGVEHVGVLFSPRTHREVAAWFDGALGRGGGTPGVGIRPVQRVGSALLLHLAAVLSFGAIASALLRRPPAPIRPTPGQVPVAQSTRGRTPEARPIRGRTPAAQLVPGRAPAALLRRRRVPVALGVPAAAVLVAVGAMTVIPHGWLPLATAGPIAGFFGVAGATILAATLATRPHVRRDDGRPRPATAEVKPAAGPRVQQDDERPWPVNAGAREVGGPAQSDTPHVRPGDGRPWSVDVGVAVVLVLLTVVSVAVPAQLGWAHAVPVGPRVWVILPVAACAAAFFGGVEVLCVGYGRLGAEVIHAWTAAGALAGLGVAVLLGVASSFVLLVAPLLAGLLVWQGVQAAALRAVRAPAWVTAVVGGVLLAWPIAVTMPII